MVQIQVSSGCQTHLTAERMCPDINWRGGGSPALLMTESHHLDTTIVFHPFALEQMLGLFTYSTSGVLSLVSQTHFQVSLLDI